MALKEYGKMVYKDRKGQLQIMQPKAYTIAVKAETMEILDLLMSGDYIMVQVAIPQETFSGNTKEE